MARPKSRKSRKSLLKRLAEVNHLERAGVWMIRRMARRDRKRRRIYLPARYKPDQDMVRSINRATWLAMIVSFIIGGLSAFGGVYVDLSLEGEHWLYHYAWVGIAVGGFTAIELLILAWLSIRLVYFIACVTGHNVLDEKESAFLNEQISTLLARAALEIPDPVHEFLGIDPLARVSRRRLLAAGVIYKLKVFLSNLAGRLLLAQIAGRYIGGKLSVKYIAVPITGLWNMFIIRKISREARLRMFGNLIARHVVEQLAQRNEAGALSEMAKEGCLRAVANSVILTQNYHPNMLLLLVQLNTALDIPKPDHLDSWQGFLITLNKLADDERFMLLNLLAISAAFDGKISPLERDRLRDAFGSFTPGYNRRIKKLKDFLAVGKLQAARDLCDLDYHPTRAGAPKPRIRLKRPTFSIR